MIWVQSVSPSSLIKTSILAFVLLFAIALIWGANSTEPVIYQVQEGSAMANSGARSDDLILSVNNKSVKTWDKTQLLLMASTGVMNTLKI